jgi:hypothetical protein
MTQIEIPPPTPRNLLMVAAVGLMIWVVYATVTDPRSNCQWMQDRAARVIFLALG